MAAGAKGLAPAALLLAAALGLGWVVLGQLDREPEAEAEAPAVAAGPPPALEPEPSFTMAPLSSFGETLERPLFSPTRRPPEPAPEVKVEPPPQPLDVTVKGIIYSTEERLAILAPKQGGADVRVPEGDTFQGWSLAEITPTAVTFKQGARQVTIDLSFDQPRAAPGGRRIRLQPQQQRRNRTPAPRRNQRSGMPERGKPPATE